MEIFQDGAFPNLEYHLFQVIWCVSALIRSCYCDNGDILWKQTCIFRFKHIWTHHIGFHGNIPKWGISQLGISLVSTDLVCFSIN